MKANTERRKRGALLACLAAPVTVIAALSSTIAGKVGTSQMELLIGDATLAAVLFVFFCWRWNRVRSHFDV